MMSPDRLTGPVALAAAIVERAQLDVTFPPMGEHDRRCARCRRPSVDCALDYLAAVRRAAEGWWPSAVARIVLGGVVEV